MTTKYPMPKPHVHAELIKAYADGAVIEEFAYDIYLTCGEPSWMEASPHRVKPTCDYALAKIAELGGDDMVELYLYWLDGGEIETNRFCHNWTLLELGDDPFKEFYFHLPHNIDITIRKKKRMVKQVLWIVTYEHPNIVKDCFFLNEDVEPKSFPEGYTEHKVPSCTREVESDD